MGASFINFIFFLATRQLYFSCVVKCCILVCWQNKVMMMMMIVRPTEDKVAV